MFKKLPVGPVVASLKERPLSFQYVRCFIGAYSKINDQKLIAMQQTWSLWAPEGLELWCSCPVCLIGNLCLFGFVYTVYEL